MRTILLSLILAATAAHAQTETKATPRQRAEVHFAQGIAAEKAGDPVAAKEAYTAALRVNPHHTSSRYRLNQLKANAGPIAARGRENKIGAVMIPKIDLENATLSETIAYIGKVVEKESKGEVTPNFVIQDPKGELTDRKITLQLKSVPTSAVLKYVTTQANAKIRYDEHAVVIEPQ